MLCTIVHNPIFCDYKNSKTILMQFSANSLAYTVGPGLHFNSKKWIFKNTINALKLKGCGGWGVNIQSVTKSIVFGGLWYAEKRTYEHLLQKKIPGEHASGPPSPGLPLHLGPASPWKYSSMNLSSSCQGLTLTF